MPKSSESFVARDVCEFIKQLKDKKIEFRSLNEIGSTVIPHMDRIHQQYVKD